MTLPPNTHWIAAMAFDRLLYCLAEGTALAAVVALALRLVPQKNSRTSFVVWFTTLTAVVLLPVIQFGVVMGTGAEKVLRPPPSGSSLITLSIAWAEYIIFGWATLAALGLGRVAASLYQIRRLRRGCVAIDQRVLGPELEAVIKEFQRRRRVSILVSSNLEVPTAIGFVRPAVLIPEWLAQGDHAEELKHVLLHELAHLQRWDDWTNLVQKLVKAVLFFHPGVWWIERKLSLDREMACDDAVLAQISSPRVYAQCLARVAERSFVRRHIALAQAAVDRVRQLTVRVTRILDGDRPRSTRIWKPALPMVGAIAVLCAISTSSTPDLVSLRDDQSAVRAAASLPNPRNAAIDRVVNRGPDATSEKNAAALVSLAKFNIGSARTQTTLKAPPTNLRSQHRTTVPARYAPAAPFVSANSALKHVTQLDRAALQTAKFSMDEGGDDRESQARQYGVVLLVMTSERVTSSGSIAWQVNMWEVRLPAPVSHPTKPIPNKT